jgi:membrane-associated protease RseP (regulator of RpoE activity)
MFKDIRVRAALHTLGLFGVAVVSGLITAFFCQTFGPMAVLTIGMIGLAGYTAVAVYDIMLLKLQHEQAAEDYRAQLEKSTTE